MRAFHITLPVSALLLRVHAQGDPSTFWKDYPACSDQCHQTVWNEQACSLQNNCAGCSGCLCLADSCLCATTSWLAATAQCIGQTCGAAAVEQAASICNNGCNSHGLSMALSPSAFIQDGLAAVPTASATSGTVPAGSSTSTATATPTPSPGSSSDTMSIGATIALAVGCAFGAALITLVGTWYRPNQIGRFVCCGRWPRKHESREQARNDMQHLITRPFVGRSSGGHQLLV